MQIWTQPFDYLWSSVETRLRSHLRREEACGHGWPLQGGDSQKGLTILKDSPLISLFSSLHSALYLSMKDTEKGIKELNLEKDKKIFNHCFTGKRPCRSEIGQLGKAKCSSQPYVWEGVWNMVDEQGHRTQAAEYENWTFLGWKQKER